MIIAVFVLAGVAVFVIAAVVIGRETQRLDRQSPRPVFDEDEAVSWVSDRLSFDVSARLAHVDVWRIMAIALANLPAAGEEATITADAETVDAVLSSPEAADHEWDAAQVRAVLDLQVQYLQIIGAAGPDRG